MDRLQALEVCKLAMRFLTSVELIEE
jgi:hypothetical protein